MASKQRTDWFIFVIASGLALFGALMVYSASAMMSMKESTESSQFTYFFKQLLFVVIGIVLMLAVSRLDYRVLNNKWIVFAILAVTSIALLAVFAFPEINGAKRWIRFAGFSFQPSEMAKLSFIIYLSAWFSRRNRTLVGDFIEDLVPFLIVLGFLGFLILKQPDTGTFGLIFLISVSIYFAAGAKISHLFGLFFAGLAMLAILIKTAPYRLQRFLVFMNPDFDPKGAGYQINQALIAIGSGGLFGMGLGYSRQKFNYLPEPVTDSIFAVFAEEWGLFVSSALILLFVFVAWQGLRVAKYAPDDFGRYVAVGIVAWVFFQAFINIAAATALIPLTGIPLPFVSYGGTSIVFLMAAMGILIRIGKDSTLKSPKHDVS